MPSTPDKKPSDQLPANPGRRRFLQFVGLGFLAFLAGCAPENNSANYPEAGQQQPRPQKLQSPTPRPEISDLERQAEKVNSRMLEMINSYKENPPAGFRDFKQLVLDTHAGISLTLSDTKASKFMGTLSELLKEGKRPEAMALIIAALDVENRKNKRYHFKDKNGKDVYTCNIYALDFARIYLVAFIKNMPFAPDCIGDYYDKVTGVAMSFGWKDFGKYGKDYSAGVRWVMKSGRYEALTGNNLDDWMERYGRKQGWQKATSLEGLVTLLNKGCIAIGVTKQEMVPKTDEHEGHVLVVFNPDPSKPWVIGRSQSTRDIAYENLYPYPNNLSEKVRKELSITNPVAGEFNYWVYCNKQS